MSVGWEQIAQRLEQAGQDVITVTVGEHLAKLTAAHTPSIPKPG